MKKIVLLFIAAAPVFTAVAQPSKIVNTINYLRDFGSSHELESLNKAKENIDLASANPDTKDMAKTQRYRAEVYVSIFDNDLRLETDKLMTSITDPNKRTLAAYQNVSSASLAEALTACKTGKTLDTKGNYTSEFTTFVARIASHYENKAIADYNAKKYADALPSFEQAYEINGVSDTSTLSNCAIVSERAAMYDKAKVYYQKMIDGKQGRGNSYSSIVNVCLMMKDTAAGMDYLKKGRAAYPNDINLVITETNYFLKINDSKQALNNLNIAIGAKPADANLYLVRGNIYDNLSNPKDAAGKDAAKPKDYDDLFKNAEADYKKAIELKPDYYDALFNLGVLYYNHGVNYNKVADEITDNAKNKAANDMAVAEYTKSLPVLEKALSVNPTDKGTMRALKQIYARLQMLDKVKEMNEKLKN